MITIQRVRLRWDTDGRGARAAEARRDHDRPVLLPDPLPSGDLVVQDVVFRAGRHSSWVSTGDALRAGVAATPAEDGTVTVIRPAHLFGAYPRRHFPKKLFSLRPGQVGRYRTNLRRYGTFSDRSWQFESWLIHIRNGPAAPECFLHTVPAHDVDDRVHLY